MLVLQAHRFQQDSSWHTGNSQHGPGSTPMFLSQSQIEQLQADGPAAAAGMVLGQPAADNNASGMSDREQMLLLMGSGALDNMAAAANAALAAGEGCVHRGNSLQMHAAATDLNNQSSNNSSQPMLMSLGNRPSHMLPTEVYDASSGAEARGGGSAFMATQSASYGTTGIHASSRGHTTGAGTSSSMRPSSPDPGALQRSASAEFENPDGSRGYVAPDEEPVPGKVAAPGRVVGMHPTGPVLPSHFGSAPITVARMGRRGEANPASLAAAAADAEEDEEGLRMMGVRSALVNDEYGQQGGGI
jgi:hypothetical protein